MREFTSRSKAVFLLWIFFSYLCFMLVFVICYHVCSLWPCGRLLSLAGLLALLSVEFSCVFVGVPCGVQGPVWCLVVSITGLGLLLYFEQ